MATELLTNSTFANTTLGAEIIVAQTDRDFSGANNWANVDLDNFNSVDDLTITTASPAGQYCELDQVRAPMTAGRTYCLTFTLNNLVSDWRITDDNASFEICRNLTGGGATNTIYFMYEGNASGGFRIIALNNDSSGDFDDFSLKRVTIDGWAENAGWRPDVAEYSLAEGANCDGSSSSLIQNTSHTLYQTYQLTLTVSGVTGGSIIASMGADSAPSITGAGSTTQYLIPTSATTFRFTGTSFDGDISAASIKLAFNIIPRWVHPLPVQFHNIITLTESQKKNYMNLSGSAAIYGYKLLFENMTDQDFWTLYNHTTLAKSGYDSFDWITVPDYIDTDQDGVEDGSPGNNLTGRWVENTFKFKPNAKTWNAEIIFEKEVT